MFAGRMGPRINHWVPLSTSSGIKRSCIWDRAVVWCGTLVGLYRPGLYRTGLVLGWQGTCKEPALYPSIGRQAGPAGGGT